jgi:hypothetical protein
MAGNLFDVFVVGASDPSPAGETRLAAALSAKHGVPLATVAKAISAKNLRAGQGLEQAQAQALVRHLQSIGAVTVIRPAAGARGQAPAASPAPAARSAGPARATPAPMSGGWPGAPSPLPAEPVADPFPQLPGPPQSNPLAAGGPAVARPPSAGPARPPSAGPAALRGRQSAGPAAPYAPAAVAPVEPAAAPKLELARGGHGASEEDMSASRSRAGVSALSLREMGMSGTSGVAMDEDPKNLNLVRCVQHGLYYDKTKASGCRKCLSPAREVASKMVADAAVLHMGGNLRSKPAKRAFLGLLFTLVLGFMPAAYYCFGPGAARVREVRMKQELLGRRPGTEEVIAEFKKLDGAVDDLHNEATRNTAVIWIAITSVSLLGWYKIT